MANEMTYDKKYHFLDSFSVFDNVVILFLPLAYGAIIQVLVSIIIKHKRRS